MANSDGIVPASDEEPKGSSGIQLPDTPKHLRSIFTVGRSNLTEEELTSSGVLKLTVNRLDDCEMEMGRLKTIESQLFESKSDLAIAKSELAQIKKQRLAYEIFTTTLAMAASAMLGASKSLFAPDLLPYGVGAAVILLVASIAAKVILR